MGYSRAMSGTRLTGFEPSAVAAAAIGLVALASAMGIGRFALTPILPLMQQDAALTLTVGGWLATGNYLGYLLGALACIAMQPRPLPAMRWACGRGLADAFDGTLQLAAAVAGIAFPRRRGERVCAGRHLRMGHADPRPSRPGGMVGARLFRRRHRDCVCRPVRPCRRHRCVGLAGNLDRARSHCGRARGAALAA